MPRKAKIKVGDRVCLKSDKNLIGVVVWKQQDSSIDIHWDFEYDNLNLKETRKSRSRLDPSHVEKVKPVNSITEDNVK